MIDIAELHRKSNSKKILGKFFATSSCRKAVSYLEYTGVKYADIIQKQKAYRGSVGIAKVHPFIVLEYLRWVDYEAYVDHIRKKLDI